MSRSVMHVVHIRHILDQQCRIRRLYAQGVNIIDNVAHSRHRWSRARARVRREYQQSQFENQHRRRATVAHPSLLLKGFCTPRNPLFLLFSHFPAPTNRQHLAHSGRKEHIQAAGTGASNPTVKRVNIPLPDSEPGMLLGILSGTQGGSPYWFYVGLEQKRS